MTSINFTLTCAPNWGDHADTVLTAGGAVAGYPVTNLKVRQMGKPWRTPTLKPHQTQFTVDFGSSHSGARESRAVFIGHINLPEDGTKVRVRKDDDVTELPLRPLIHYNGGGNTFLAATNTTGAPSDLGDDPLSPDANYVTPTNASLDMDFRLRFQPPPAPLHAGEDLQVVRVAYAATSTTANFPILTATLWQNGVDLGITGQVVGWDDGETTTNRILEVRFQRSDLNDESGALVELRILAQPLSGENIKIAAVRWNATLENKPRVINPVDGNSYLEKVNCGSTSTATIQVQGLDMFNRTDNNFHEPTTAGSAMQLRLPLQTSAIEGLLYGGTDQQYLVVAFQSTTGAGTPSVRVELWQNGVDLTINQTQASAGTTRQFLVMPFSRADLADESGEGVQIRIVTTPSGTDNVKIAHMGFWAVTTQSHYLYDTGWMEAFEVPPESTLGTVAIPGDIGKPVRRSVPVLFRDDAGDWISLGTRYTKVEFLIPGPGVGSPGLWSFTSPEDGTVVTWLDAGRYAEGPAIENMNLADGFDISVVDLSNRDESDGGVMWEDEEDVYRIFRLRLTNVRLELAASDLFDYLFRRLGITHDLLVVIFPELAMGRRFLHLWGPLAKPGRLSHDTVTRFRADLEIRERL